MSVVGTVVANDGDHRLPDERCQIGSARSTLVYVIAARSQIECPGGDPQLGVELSLVLVEQLSTPVEGGASVSCRAETSELPSTSSSNRFMRRARIAAERAHRRAAASSIASGSPSRARQMAAMSLALASVSSKSGRTAVAFDEQLDRRVSGGVVERSGRGRRQRERWDRPRDLARDPERSTTGGEHADVTGQAEDAANQRGDGANDVLTGVQHEQAAGSTRAMPRRWRPDPRLERRGPRGHWRPSLPQGPCRRRWRDRRTTRRPFGPDRCGLERQPALAGTGRSGQCDDAAAAEQLIDAGQLDLSTDERGVTGTGMVALGRVTGRGRRGVVRLVDASGRPPEAVFRRPLASTTTWGRAPGSGLPVHASPGPARPQAPR